MAIARCDLTKLTGRVIAALNAGTAATWTTSLSASDDNRRNTTEIQNAILAADAQVCLAICETPGHGYRTLFMADTALLHAQKLPEHIGPIGAVKIQPYAAAAGYVAGKPMDADDVDAYYANTNLLYDPIAHNLAGSSLAGYFNVTDSEFRYTGFAASVQLANFTRSGACQAPESYEDAVLSLAVMDLVKEGDSAPFANIFTQQGQQYLNLIRSGAMIIQPVQMVQAA